MKKTAALFLSLSMIFALSACGSRNGTNNTANTQSERENVEVSTEKPAETVLDESSRTSTEELAQTPTEEPAQAPTETVTEEASGDAEITEGKTLVVYFSATGNTEEAANYIAAATGADVFELVPAEPYSSDDLNYSDDNSRVVYEHDNPDARTVELEKTTVDNWEAYDTVFIGYPIWWHIAAWPVDDFIAANDFTGKTVIPFCTSSSSGLGDSGELLADAAGTGDWLEGMRFSSSVTEEDVQTWVDSLGL